MKELVLSLFLLVVNFSSQAAEGEGEVASAIMKILQRIKAKDIKQLIFTDNPTEELI